MFDFHNDRILYYEQQQQNTKQYVIPYIQRSFALKPGMHVLEVGCGEGGVLKPFVEFGCIGTGVDPHKYRVDLAIEFMKEDVEAGRAQFVTKSIYDDECRREFKGMFDLIVLKDTLEHIPDQEQLIPLLREYLAPRGVIFFAFPPWCMPFGGHQQMCSRKWLSMIPYFHLLPLPLYRGILKLAKEDPTIIDELENIYSTRISLARFERILRASRMIIISRLLYLINPNYQIKFNLTPREQPAVLRSIPYLRDFFTTTAFYIVGVDETV
ncbi:MAG TPA: class I SAM-dependent methyltransferase [Bacteroidota bacterium]|nr:class I SAM-dependent methyltransferase [Bacteroidota bacterium]